MRWLHGFAVLCTLIPLGAQGQDSLKYAPDLQPGKVTRAEVDLDIRQTLTLAGMPLETANSMFIVARERVGETTADGGRVLLGEYETLQGDMSLPGGITFNFNSNNPERDLGGEVQEMIGSYFRALVGARWKLVTDADFKVISAVYIDDPFAQVHEFFKSDTNPEQLKQRVNTELARYPGKAVQVGDSWTRTEQFNAGAGQTLEFEQVFTWLGTEARNGKTYDKVGVKTLGAKLTVDDNRALPSRVTESQLKIADAEGTLWYDREERRFTENHEKVHITGTLTLEAQGMKFPGELDLTIESKSTSKFVDP